MAVHTDENVLLNQTRIRPREKVAGPAIVDERHVARMTQPGFALSQIISTILLPTLHGGYERHFAFLEV